MKHFIQELPRHYGRSPQDAELQRVLENMAVRAEADKDFTLEQLFPSTASGWGLELWEKAWGLRREAAQTEAQRRARVLGRVKGTGTTTTERIRGIVRALLDLDSEVTEDYPRYAFYVMVKEIPLEWTAGFQELWTQIALLKPAHLDFWIIGRFSIIPLVNTPGTFQFQRLEIPLRARSYGRGVVWLDGARRLDGSWLLDQRFQGMAWRHVSFSIPIQEQTAVSGAVFYSSAAVYTRNKAHLSGVRAGAAARGPAEGLQVRLDAGLGAAARAGYCLTGTLVRDTMWRMDGGSWLDGRRRLNAAIVKEEI